MPTALQSLYVGGKDVRKSASAEMEFTSAETVLGAWLFNRADANDDVARRICSRNRAIGARDNPEDRVIIGAPQVFDDFFRFTANDAIRTGLYEPDEYTLYALCRCADVNVGATSADRAHVMGTFGNTANNGTSIVYNSMSVVRGISYDKGASGTPGIVTHDLTVPANTINKWRVLRMYVASSAMRLRNMTGDSTTNEPVAEPFPNGRQVGKQKFSIGARLESGKPSVSYTRHVDIAAAVIVEGFNDLSAQQALFLADLKKQLARTSLVEGSTAP